MAQQPPYPYYAVLLNSLSAVSCGATGSCEAVGTDGGNDVVWAMVFDGTQWISQPIPNVGSTGYYSSGLDDQSQYGLRDPELHVAVGLRGSRF